MLVPEVDLNLQIKDGMVNISPVPMTEWHRYFASMEAIAACVTDELEELPDIQPLDEMISMLGDLRCIMASVGLFYDCTMREIERINKYHSNPAIQRYRNYRKKMEE